MRTIIKLNGHYYEAYAEDLCELAEDFINNINHVCEITLKDDTVRFEWPGINCFTFLRLSKK